MTNYLVVCRDERHAGNLFHSLVAHMRRNNMKIKASLATRSIQDSIGGLYRIRFMGEKRYYDVGQHGFHGEVVWDTTVEQYLDGSAPRHILIK